MTVLIPRRSLNYDVNSEVYAKDAISVIHLPLLFVQMSSGLILLVLYYLHPDITLEIFSLNTLASPCISGVGLL